MSDHLLVWDQGSVALWTRRGGRVEAVARGEAADVDALRRILSGLPLKGAVQNLWVALDAPWLDHHVEKIPPARRRVLDDLVARRLEKRGGAENARHDWMLHPLPARNGSSLQLLVSMPPALCEMLATHAREQGVWIKTIGSLPLALAKAASPGKSGHASIPFGDATHLAYYDETGAPLYFLRCPSGAASEERAARRLSLFIEQEFGLATAASDTPRSGVWPDSEEARVAAIWDSLDGRGLFSRANFARQLRSRTRVALLCGCLLALPLLGALSVRAADRHNRAVAQTEDSRRKHAADAAGLVSAETRLAGLKRNKDLMDFSLGREIPQSGQAELPDAPLLVLTSSLCSVLPEGLEIDQLSIGAAPKKGGWEIAIKGRPSGPEVNLDTRLDIYAAAIKGAGFSVVDEKRELARGAASLSATRLGRPAEGQPSRQFTYTFVLRGGRKP